MIAHQYITTPVRTDSQHAHVCTFLSSLDLDSLARLKSLLELKNVLQEEERNLVEPLECIKKIKKLQEVSATGR